MRSTLFMSLVATSALTLALLGVSLPTSSNLVTTASALEARDTDVWPASNVQSTGTNFIIEFWVLWWWLDIPIVGSLLPLITYSAYGVPDQCYELSPTSSQYGIDWTRLTGSAKLGTASSSCTVWRGQDCTGDSTPVNTGGISIYDGELQSFKCVA